MVDTADARTRRRSFASFSPYAEVAVAVEHAALPGALRFVSTVHSGHGEHSGMIANCGIGIARYRRAHNVV